MENKSLQEEWNGVAVNPDPAKDLGYKYEPLTTIKVEEEDGQFIFLPSQEDHLTDSEFIIASAASINDLTDQC